MAENYVVDLFGQLLLDDFVLAPPQEILAKHLVQPLLSLISLQQFCPLILHSGCRDATT